MTGGYPLNPGMDLLPWEISSEDVMAKYVA